MILFVVKFILCSTALFILFKIFLSKEKSFLVNRAVLLLILPLAAIAPLLSVPIGLAPTEHAIFLEQTLSPISSNQIAQPLVTTKETTPINWVFLAYLIVAGTLLISKSLSILTLMKWQNQGDKLILKDTNIVITEKAITPFSFLNTIFLNRKNYEEGYDLGVIVSHETAHISQKHYLDLFFLEFLNIIFWFNPICYFIKYQAQINHEYLADQAILERDFDINYYKRTLFKFSTSNLIPLTSPIVSSTLKLRMTMLNKIQNNRIQNLSLLISCLLGILTWGAFTIELQAQEVKPTPTTHVNQDVQSSDQLSKAAKELDAIIKSSTKIKINPSGEEVRQFWMGGIDKLQVYNLYNELPESERTGDRKTFGEMMITLSKSPEKNTISAQQLKDWQDSKEYGVWVDGKRVDNADLSEANSGDYAFYNISRLEKNAINYGKHYFQVNLMTHAYYDKTYPILKVNK